MIGGSAQSGIVSGGTTLPVLNEPGDFQTSSSVEVGPSGFGTLLVDNGSELRAPNLGAGQQTSGQGEIRVSGVGSAIIITDPAPMTFSGAGFGQQGAGSLWIDAGGLVDSRSELTSACTSAFCNMIFGNGAGASAELLIEGGGSLISGASGASGAGFVLGQAAVVGSPPVFGTPGGSTVVTATVRNGGLLDTFGCVIGRGPAGDGVIGSETTTTTLTIEDSGSLWLVEDFSSVAGVAPRDCFIGQGVDATATVTVRDAAQLMVDEGAILRVGDGGSVGALSVETSGSAAMRRLEVGTSEGSGTLIVDASSSVSLSGISASAGALLALGLDGGDGSALIEGALHVDTTAGGAESGIAVGVNGGGNGVLTVQGPSGQLDVTGPASMAIGYQAPSTGTVQVLNGGSASIGGVGQGVLVGFGGSGLLEVRGTGSNFDAGAFVQIGSGNLTVASGGLVGAGQVTLADAGATLSGDGTIQAPVQANSGRIEPGLSAGVLTVDALVVDGATVQIEVEGSAPGTFDELIVNGAADFVNGSFEVVVAPGVDLSSPISLVFATAAGGVAYAPGGFSVQASQNGTPVAATVAQSSPTTLDVTVVPEPTSRSALIAGVAALCLLRRRRTGGRP